MRHDIHDPYTWRLERLEPIDAETVVADPGHRDELIIFLAGE